MEDRTQLFSLLSVTRYGSFCLTLAGVLVALLANHALAGLVGLSFGRLLDPKVLGLVIGASMIGTASWTLLPDKPSECHKAIPQRDVFLTTVVAFFIAEIGDKTQIATMALAAAFQP